MPRTDDDEFATFARSAAPGLRRTAYLMCGDWDRAADLTQEALIRVYVAWPRLDRGDGRYAYARRVTTNAAIDQARRRSAREVPTLELVDRSVDDATGQIVDRALLLGALAELPARQRACVVLRYYEDLSVETVARTLGCRPGTVKSQTARGLETLRAAYARQGGELRTPVPDVPTRAQEVLP